MIDLEQLKRDRVAGTPGPWTWETESGEWPDHVLVDANGDSVMWFDLDIGFRFASEGVKRLIARVPDLEAMVLEQADEIERLRAAYAQSHEIRIGLHEKLAEVKAELTAAREQVAGAYESLRTKMIGAWHLGYEHGKYLVCDNPIACCDKEVEMAIPADATAALEARDARVRAEERERIHKIVRKCADDGDISYGAAQWVIDALHTEASREVK